MLELTNSWKDRSFCLFRSRGWSIISLMFNQFQNLHQRPYFWIGTIIGIVIAGFLSVSL